MIQISNLFHLVQYAGYLCYIKNNDCEPCFRSTFLIDPRLLGKNCLLMPMYLDFLSYIVNFIHLFKHSIDQNLKTIFWIILILIFQFYANGKCIYMNFLRKQPFYKISNKVHKFTYICLSKKIRQTAPIFTPYVSYIFCKMYSFKNTRFCII